jgi:hypothetical protein
MQELDCRRGQSNSPIPFAEFVPCEVQLIRAEPVYLGHENTIR